MTFFSGANHVEIKLFQLVKIFDPNVENQASINAQNHIDLHLFHKEVNEFIEDANVCDIEETLTEHSIISGTQIIINTTLLIKKTKPNKFDILYT